MRRGITSPYLIAIILLLSFIAGVIFGRIHGPFNKLPIKIPEPTSQVNSTNSLRSWPNFQIQQLGRGLAGKLLYSFDDSIFSSNLDGSEAKQLISAVKYPHLGYAGISKQNLYFTSFPLDQGDIETVYRYNFKTGLTSKIFEFKLNDKNKEFYLGNTSIDPSENYLAYTADDGLHLYSLNSKTDKRILVNGTCQGFNNKTQTPLPAFDKDGRPPNCDGYDKPYWSFDGSRLAITEFHYEGASGLVINPFSGAVIGRDLSGGYDRWAPNKNILAIIGSGYGYQEGVEIFNETKNPKYTDLLAQFPDYIGDIDNASWSEDGKLLFTLNDPQKKVSKLILLDTIKPSLKTILENPLDDKIFDYLNLPQGNGAIVLDSNNHVYLISYQATGKYNIPIEATRLITIY